ncbi:MAG: thermonuclease family protein [Parvularculaceae bacterium]
MALRADMERATHATGRPRGRSALGAPAAGFVFAALGAGGWFFLASGGMTAEPPAPAATYEGSVTRIVDGDTFYLSSAKMRVRVWGLDAPETGTPGGAEATKALAEIAFGKRLTCEKMNTDRYERIVARCTLPSGEDIAALMIESGTAREYRAFSKGYYARHGVKPRMHR